MIFILDPVEQESQEFGAVQVGKGLDPVFIPPGRMGHFFQPLQIPPESFDFNSRNHGVKP
jgi:hypothetical protein